LEAPMKHFQVLERPRFFHGKLLTAADFQQEQEYFLARLRRRNRIMHGWGVVSGLGVGLEKGTTVVIEPGLAIDCAGNEVVVEAEVRISLTGRVGRQYLVLCYEEVNVSEVPTSSGGTEFSRVRESMHIEFASHNPNAGHRGMGRGTPGCGRAHALCIATISKRGSRWSVAAASNGA
jgi:hypothetical protein